MVCVCHTIPTQPFGESLILHHQTLLAKLFSSSVLSLSQESIYFVKYQTTFHTLPILVSFIKGKILLMHSIEIGNEHEKCRIIRMLCLSHEWFFFPLVTISLQCKTTSIQVLCFICNGTEMLLKTLGGICLQLSCLWKSSSQLTSKKCLQVLKTSLHAVPKGQSAISWFSHVILQAPQTSNSSTCGEVLGNLPVIS